MTIKLLSLKFILIPIGFSFTLSCNSLPNCSDNNVKKKVISQYKKESQPALLEERINSMGDNELRVYADKNGLNYDDSLDRQKILNGLATHVNIDLMATKLVDIRTEKIEKEINKCSCEGELKNPHLKDVEIRYSVQKAEESKDGIVIKIDYNVKKEKINE